MLDRQYLKALSTRGDSAASDLQAAVADKGQTVTYAMDPCVAPSAAKLLDTLPADVQRVYEIVTGSQESVRPHNAIMQKWVAHGLSTDVDWNAAGSLLQLQCNTPEIIAVRCQVTNFAQGASQHYA